MKTYILIILFAFQLLNCQAQSGADSVKVHKNEIGINLVPLIKICTFNGNNYNQQYSLNYKRQLRKHLFYRTSLALVTHRDEQTAASFYEIAGETTNTVFIKYHFLQHGNEKNIYQGLEYRWGKKKIKQFCGADLNYSRSKTYFSEYFGERDKNTSYVSSTGLSYFTVDYFKHNGQFLNPFNDSTITKYSSISQGIGITPFYGMQFHFTKRLFFSVQIGMYFSYQFIKTIYTVDNQNKYNDQYKYSEWLLNHAGLSNNFCLFYRF